MGLVSDDSSAWADDAHTARAAGFSAAFLALVAACQAQHVQVIRLDADGFLVPEAPTFPWP